MAMKLPTYNQPGWGATLNNYLRELNQRISKVEANNGSSSNGVGQVFGASAFSTGLTSTASTCLYNGVEQCSTFLLDSGLNNLAFTGEYFISQSTVEGNAFLGKLNGKEDWGSSTSLNSNQTMLVCADEERTLHIIPFTQAKNNRELDYNLCRLGYITRIGTDDNEYIYFTPCPNLAIMDLHDKYNYLMRPTYKSNDSEKPQIAVGSYSYMMEGLNYYQHFENQSKTNTTPLQVLDGELYNIHTFEGVTDYFLIQEEGEKEVIKSKCNSQELEDHINSSENKIFIFYVTIAGIIFVREISLKEEEQIVDSTSLANFLVDTKFEENNALFYNYSWLKPLELKRCGKDPFGNLRWHTASYNGISPQIVGTPIHTVDTNYYWADNYLLQIDNSDESARNYYGLRIRPYVQLDKNGEEGDYTNRIANEQKINEYVVLNVSDESTPESDATKPGFLLYNYPFREHLYFGGTVLSKDNDKVIFEIRNTGLYNSDYHLFFKKGIEAPLTIEGNDLSNISIYNKFLIGSSESRQDDNTLNLNWDTGVAYFKAAQVNFSTDTIDSISKAAFLINDSENEYYKLLVAKDSDWKVLEDNINNPIYKYTDSHQKLKIYFTVAVTDKYTGTSYSPLTGFQEFTFPHTTSAESPLVFTSSGFSVSFYYNDTTQEFQIISFTPPSGATNVSGVYFKKFEYYQESFTHNLKGSSSILGNVSIVGEASFSSSLTAGNSKFKVTSGGNCSAIDFTVTSDERYKNLYSHFTNSGLNIINQLPIYNYSFKITPEKETIGITAQDLLKVLPQLVDTSDESHYKINESKLVYVCMQAIKELNSKIIKLEDQIQNLRGN